MFGVFSSVLSTARDFFHGIAVPPFALSSLKDFPYANFTNNQQHYRSMKDWYDGAFLTNTQFQEGRKVDKYPVRINPFKNIVAKHTAALLGEFREDDRPIISPKVSPKNPKNAGAKAIAKRIEDILETVYQESNGRAIQLENATFSQIYGGCVFKLSWVPEEVDNGYRTIPVRIESVKPENFICTPKYADGWRLQEAWTVTRVTKKDAEFYGVPNLLDTDIIYLIEYWSETRHTLRINGNFATTIINNEKYEWDEENTFGFVPVVYIPHIRSGNFFGDSALEPIIGLVEELNLRFADYGDSVSDDSHKLLALRNVQGTPNITRLASGTTFINLGSSPAQLTGNGNSSTQPDAFEISTSSASEPMHKLIDLIYGQLRRDAFIPPVADGEDEGSQRSSLTLETRFWPLTTHAGMERINWNTGLNLLHSMVLKMLIIREEIDITMDQLNEVKFKCSFHSMLPKDRDSLVAEVTNRRASKTISLTKALELYADVDDVDAERSTILEDEKELAKIVAMETPKPPPGDSAGSPKKPAKPSSGG